MHIHNDLHRHAVPVTLPAAFAGSEPGQEAATSSSTNLYHRVVKRVLDLAIILVAAPALIPVLAILALIVAATGRSPLYRQTRVGLNGKTFTMWKFTSMIPDADAALARHLQTNPAARAEWSRTQKLKNDPRITPVGRFLRRTSLDELPQLLNVLTGEMSLVGPRPMLPEQQIMYPGTAYYRMLPGITGLWQVSRRNETAFAERAYFDTRYHANLSFMTDIKTLLATLRVVVRATGH